MEQQTNSQDIKIPANAKNQILTVNSRVSSSIGKDGVVTISPTVDWTIKDDVDNPVPLPEPKVYTLPKINNNHTPNYQMGMCNFGTPSFSYDTKSVYDRWTWAQLQTTTGTLNTKVLTDFFESAKAKKQTVNFRIGMFDTGGTYGSIKVGGINCFYPQYVHDLMQSEDIKDWNNGSVWFPNWNSAKMLDAWKNFLIILKQWIVQNGYYNMIDFLDIGGFGNFKGEWHMDSLDSIQNTHKTKITTASQISFIQYHMQTFDDLYSIGNQAMLDNRYAADDFIFYVLSTSNKAGLMGFRTDHLGWYSVIAADKARMNRSINGLNILTNYQRRYLFAPMIGEPMNNVSGVTPPNGTPYQTLKDDVKDFGLSQFENVASATSAVVMSNYLDACEAIGGYGIDSVTINQDGTYSVIYFKKGTVNILYRTWITKLIADGKDVNNVVPKDTKTLSISLVDPSGYRNPMYLLNSGRQADGSYKVF